MGTEDIHVRLRQIMVFYDLLLIVPSLLSIINAPDLASYWHKVLKEVGSNERDTPFAVIYSREIDMHSKAQSPNIYLQTALGVDEGHPLAVKCVNLRQGNEAIIPLLQRTITTNGPTVFQRSDGNLPEALLQDVRWRGFGEPSTALAVLPLTAGEEVLGFLLIGLNPRRAYDEDYARFLELLNRQLSMSLTSATLMEQARRKQAELSKDLAAGESKFKALTELNAAGLCPTNYDYCLFADCNSSLFYISPLGEVLYANETCASITTSTNVLHGRW